MNTFTCFSGKLLTIAATSQVLKFLIDISQFTIFLWFEFSEVVVGKASGIGSELVFEQGPGGRAGVRGGLEARSYLFLWEVVKKASTLI